MVIILIGPPASGKGTISRLLSQEFDLPLISVGKMLRDIPPDSIWYEPIKQAMDKGELASNRLLGGFLSEVVKDSHYERGYILDGWARQLSDLDHFDPDPDAVVFLNVSYKTSKDRILSRRVCERGDHTYNLISKPPKKEGVCDVDGSKLLVRDDDTEEVLEHRWEVFNNKTTKVIKHFRDLGKLVEVVAEGRPQSIFAETLEKLKPRLE